MKNLFIGIDFSKKKFDVTFFERNNINNSKHESFENNTEGCKHLLKWINAQTNTSESEWLFCGEHTGLYSVLLAEFLLSKGLFVWIENPMQIKYSMGVKREKNDKIDSKEIALYAFRFQDKAKCFQLQDKSLKSLQLLLTFRARLIRNKNVLLVSAQEMRTVLKRDCTARYIYEQSKKDVERIDKEIKTIELKMLNIIKESESIKENYDLATSVKGIAKINAITMLVYTGNFTRFESARQFACYSGVVPFERTSGSSIRGGSHVSKLANVTVKTLLTQAARSAVMYDQELKEYYQRKIKEGKLDKVVINNVRNKLIMRVFAVVTKKKPYQQNYINSLNTNAA